MFLVHSLFSNFPTFFHSTLASIRLLLSRNHSAAANFSSYSQDDEIPDQARLPKGLARNDACLGYCFLFLVSIIFSLYSKISFRTTSRYNFISAIAAIKSFEVTVVFEIYILFSKFNLQLPLWLRYDCFFVAITQPPLTSQFFPKSLKSNHNFIEIPSSPFLILMLVG